jgi:hypothetical protein
MSVKLPFAEVKRLTAGVEVEVEGGWRLAVDEAVVGAARRIKSPSSSGMSSRE